VPVVGDANDLMAEDHRELRRVDLVVAEVEVGPADRARLDGEAELAGLWPWVGVRVLRVEPERLAGLVKDSGAHLHFLPQVGKNCRSRTI
jgi:hypothetical protein